MDGSLPRASPAPSKLIFLDIDGVICCNSISRLEEAKLKQLKRVVSETGNTKVVLSSDWRRQQALKRLVVTTLKQYGIKCIGATPQRSMMQPVRPMEILSWLSANGPSVEGGVTAWIAIDDRNLLLESGGQDLKGHFVHTHISTGLTVTKADQAIKLLNAEETPVSSPEPGRASTSSLIADSSDLPTDFAKAVLTPSMISSGYQAEPSSPLVRESTSSTLKAARRVTKSPLLKDSPNPCSRSTGGKSPTLCRGNIPTMSHPLSAAKQPHSGRSSTPGRSSSPGRTTTPTNVRRKQADIPAGSTSQLPVGQPKSSQLQSTAKETACMVPTEASLSGGKNGALTVEGTSTPALSNTLLLPSAPASPPVTLTQAGKALSSRESSRKSLSLDEASKSSSNSSFATGGVEPNDEMSPASLQESERPRTPSRSGAGRRDSPGRARTPTRLRHIPPSSDR